jgi:hypothetical protein
LVVGAADDGEEADGVVEVGVAAVVALTDVIACLVGRSRPALERAYVPANRNVSPRTT